MEFFDTIRDKVISFRKGVRNLCYFFNVIWNYRDFDYSYMLGVEERIMESMKKYFEECHIAEADPETARDLGLCLKILKEMENCTDYWYAEEREGHSPIKKINMNNAPSFHKRMMAGKGKNNRLIQYDWYEAKCWRLYNLIRMNKMQTWWN